MHARVLIFLLFWSKTASPSIYLHHAWDPYGSYAQRVASARLMHVSLQPMAHFISGNAAVRIRSQTSVRRVDVSTSHRRSHASKQTSTCPGGTKRSNVSTS